MSYEFECFKCKAFTIFKEITDIPKQKRVCAQCGRFLSVEKNLVRFDRTDKDKMGLLLSTDEAINQRLVELSERLADLTDQVERLSMILLDSSRDED